MRFPASFPEAGKDGRWEEKGNEEDEMAGWHHRLDGHEFEQASRVGDRQESLACYSPWGGKGSDMTEQLNRTLLKVIATLLDGKEKATGFNFLKKRKGSGSF